MIRHSYTGVNPPFTGVAVKTTLVPGQIPFVSAVILTLGVKIGKIETEIELLVAFNGSAHAEVVITTEISSPSVKLLLV